MHWKMFKSGKFWVFSASVVSAMIIGSSSIVHATTSISTDSENVVSSKLSSSSAEIPTNVLSKSDTSAVSSPTSSAQPEEPMSKGEASATSVSAASSSTKSQVKSATPEVSSTQAQASATPKEDDNIDQWMPNKRLQNLVLFWLRQDGTGKTWQSVSDITKDDMLQLKTIDNYWGIDSFQETFIDGISSYSLEGLQYATNLKNLVLRSSLNYQHQAFYGDITDISPLANLTKLQYIELGGNRISDVTPLSKLSHVTYLNLTYNAIADWSPLNVAQYTGEDTYVNVGSISSSGQIDPAKSSSGTIGQVVVTKPIYVGKIGDIVNMTSPLKLPDGTIAPLKNYSKAGFGQIITLDSNHLLRFFYNAGASTSDGTTGLKYQVSQDQEPGAGVTYPNYKIIPNEYKYYLIGQYYAPENSANPVATVLTPYIMGQQPTLTGEDFTMHVGDKTPSADDFKAAATDIDGKAEAVDVDLSKADLTKPGDYKVTLSTQDGQTKSVTLHVLADQRSINGESFTMHVGDKTPSADDFKATATDIDGKAEAVDVDLSNADLTKAGDYKVTLSTKDGQSTVVTLHVLTKKAEQVVLIIYYVDQSGNLIQQYTQKIGSKGESYTVETPTIKGYRYLSTNHSLTGILDGDLTITLTYAKASNKPGSGSSNKPSKKPEPNNSDRYPNKDRISNKTLPQTGDNQGSSMYTLLGTFMTSALLLFSTVYKRHHEK